MKTKIKLSTNFSSYDYRKLINTRILDKVRKSKQHIVCDIDKTYLETKSENAIQVLKIAFEDAKAKITVSGASLFLLTLRWSNPWQIADSINFEPRSLHFVSASPPQLRNTLEEKLIKDGLDWTSDSFKNQAYNIRKAKLGLLRHHVAYKTATIVNLMANAETDSGEFFLIGDSAEYDAFIYLFLGLYLEKRISVDTYCQILRFIGVQDEVAEELKERLVAKPKAKVSGILIRRVPGVPFTVRHPITSPIAMYDDYFEASLIALKWGLIDLNAFRTMTLKFHNEQGFSRSKIVAHLKAALTGMFADETEIRQTLQKLVAELLEIGETDQVDSSLETFKPMKISDLDLNEGELLEYARLWAEDLTQR